MTRFRHVLHQFGTGRDSVTSLTTPSKSKAQVSCDPSTVHTRDILTPSSPLVACSLPGYQENETFYEDRLTGNQLRLLRIEPGEHSAPLVCNLVPVQLLEDQYPRYTALSYCWGSISQPSTSITINARQGFRISRHLRDGLIRLRRDDKPHHVWIDAICINQANLGERNHQVDRMRSIFGKAYSVVVWLGEFRGSATQPTCKCHVPRGNGHASQAVCAEPGLSSLEHGYVTQNIRDKLHSDERRSRDPQYLGQVWWKRLWIIQEFCVAERLPVVSIGPHTISWDFFSTLLWPGRDDHILQRLRRTARQSLLDLLLSTSNDFYCSEPRDRIYALLGLIDNGVSSAPIEANYEKPVAAVFEDAMLYLIRQERSVDCLLDKRTNRLVDNSKDVDGQLPTWIPRFAFMRDSARVRTPDQFNAGYLTPYVSLVHHPAVRIFCGCETDRALQLRALPFDNILHRADMSKISSSTSPARRNLLRQLQVDYSKPTKLDIDRAPNIGYLILEFLFAGTDVSLVDTFERARQEMRITPGLTYVPRYAYSEQLATEFGFPYNDATILDLTIAMTFEDLFKKKLSAKHAAREIKTRFGIYTAPPQDQDRVFFSTTTGFSGLGPASLEPGDSVIVPFGSSRPFIIRGHGDHYILIGDAVIPGIMSGQLMDLHQRGLAPSADFSLK